MEKMEHTKVQSFILQLHYIYFNFWRTETSLDLYNFFRQRNRRKSKTYTKTTESQLSCGESPILLTFLDEKLSPVEDIGFFFTKKFPTQKIFKKTILLLVMLLIPLLRLPFLFYFASFVVNYRIVNFFST